MSQWHGGKGSKPRKVVDQDQFESNWDAIFNKDKADYKEVQQDLTELNGDGNRTRGRYGEDNAELNDG